MDKAKKTTLEWFTYSSGAIVAMILFMGGIFKLNHWPGANILTILGLVTLVGIFLPALFINMYRKSSERFERAA